MIKKLYGFIDGACGVDSYNSYNYDERRNATIWKTIVTIIIAIFVILVISFGVSCVKNISEAKIIYIGQIKKMTVEDTKTSISIISLIQPESNLDFFGLNKKYIWTHVKDAQQENKDMLLNYRFSKTFLLKGGNIKVKQGDTVKIYAKGDRIKFIALATERDLINATTVVVRGKLKSYIEEDNKQILNLFINNKQIVGAKSSVNLSLTKNDTQNFEIGKEYEFVNKSGEDKWSITEILTPNK